MKALNKSFVVEVTDAICHFSVVKVRGLGEAQPPAPI